MIDRKLVKEASEKSKYIAEIDYAWRQAFDRLKARTFKLPFQGNYKALVKESRVLVEGFVGEHRIDKLCDGKTTYALVNPVVVPEYSLFGVFECNGIFSGFCSQPVIGFHYLGMERQGFMMICTGQLHAGKIRSYEGLKKACFMLKKALEVINLQSLGSTFLPREYEDLGNAVLGNLTPGMRMSTVGYMRKHKLIVPLLEKEHKEKEKKDD